MNKVLDVQNLHVSFDTYAGEVKAVRGVTFSLSEGEVLAIVGESGCGKSVTAQTIMKLNPMPPARIKEGSVQLGEHDIVAANEKEMQKIRGKEVSMINFTHLRVLSRCPPPCSFPIPAPASPWLPHRLRLLPPRNRAPSASRHLLRRSP